MPSVSRAQHALMAGCAHGWHPAGVKCPDQATASEFATADKGRKISRLPGHVTAARKAAVAERAR